MGVEKETFWGKIEAERAAYFVGISRPKQRLVLTACDHRHRPKGASRWTSERTAQTEFLGYATRPASAVCFALKTAYTLSAGMAAIEKKSSNAVIPTCRHASI